MAKRMRQKAEELEPFIRPRNRHGEPNMAEPPFPIPENLLIALRRLKITFTHDEFSRRSYMQMEGAERELITNEAIAGLRIQIWMLYRFKLSKQDHVDLITSVAMANGFHPLRQYLDDVAQGWDGVPRLDDWLVKFAGAEDSEFNRVVGAIWMIAAVRRARQPGCKFDELPVFEGPQGSGKSTMLRILAVHDEWFTDCVPIGADPKIVIEQTVGKWIAELAELAGMAKKETEHVKSFASRQSDESRLAYGKGFAVYVPRAFVCAGTCNPIPGEVAQYLKDPTGARRFLPITLGRIDLKGLRGVVAQLWGEAAAREAKDESIALPSHLYPSAKAAQDARQEGNAFSLALGGTLAGINGGVLLKTNVHDLLGLPITARHHHNQVAVTSAMRSLGWVAGKRRLNGDLVPVYVKRNLWGSEPWLEVKWSEYDRRFMVVPPREEPMPGPEALQRAFRKVAAAETDDTVH